MEKQQAVGGRATREVYDGMGHIDIILSLSRIYRGKSKVLADIRRFVIEESVKGV